MARKASVKFCKGAAQTKGPSHEAQQAFQKLATALNKAWTGQIRPRDLKLHRRGRQQTVEIKRIEKAIEYLPKLAAGNFKSPQDKLEALQRYMRSSECGPTGAAPSQYTYLDPYIYLSQLAAKIATSTDDELTAAIGGTILTEDTQHWLEAARSSRKAEVSLHCSLASVIHPIDFMSRRALSSERYAKYYGARGLEIAFAWRAGRLLLFKNGPDIRIKHPALNTLFGSGQGDASIVLYRRINNYLKEDEHGLRCIEIKIVLPAVALRGPHAYKLLRGKALQPIRVGVEHMFLDGKPLADVLKAETRRLIASNTGLLDRLALALKAELPTKTSRRAQERIVTFEEWLGFVATILVNSTLQILQRNASALDKTLIHLSTLDDHNILANGHLIPALKQTPPLDLKTLIPQQMLHYYQHERPHKYHFLIKASSDAVVFGVEAAVEERRHYRQRAFQLLGVEFGERFVQSGTCEPEAELRFFSNQLGDKAGESCLRAGYFVEVADRIYDNSFEPLRLLRALLSVQCNRWSLEMGDNSAAIYYYANIREGEALVDKIQRQSARIHKELVKAKIKAALKDPLIPPEIKAKMVHERMVPIYCYSKKGVPCSHVVKPEDRKYLADEKPLHPMVAGCLLPLDMVLHLLEKITNNAMVAWTMQGFEDSSWRFLDSILTEMISQRSYKGIYWESCVAEKSGKKASGLTFLQSQVNPVEETGCTLSKNEGSDFYYAETPDPYVALAKMYSTMLYLLRK